MASLVAAGVVPTDVPPPEDPFGPPPNDGGGPTGPQATTNFDVDDEITGGIGRDVHPLVTNQTATVTWSVTPTIGCASASILDSDGGIIHERTNICLASGDDWSLPPGAWSVVF